MYAHTTDGPPSTWEPLRLHLSRTAVGDHAVPGAGTLADAFSARSWGEIAGWWHDLGKYSSEFQDYLLRATGHARHDAHIERSQAARVDHSTFGARHAASRGHWGRLLAWCIAGHHSGLPDTQELDNRLAKDLPDAEPPSDLTALKIPVPPDLTWGESKPERAFQLAFFTRMVFSALVDADFLATEVFMAPDRAARRTDRPSPDRDALSSTLSAYLDGLESGPATAVNIIRRDVRAACVAKAGLPAGFFTLTVPTGGGKTLTSLDFALRHAALHGLRRVIFAVPFTSIIEQTVDVYRRALAPHGDAVLEHHSNFEPREDDRWSRLASENWDAPLVVTTTVQLYESLFACKPSRCRKLNRLARSVIVLDEAQAIPVTLLAPTLAALQELVRNYGCTVVLCTATQPAIGKRAGFPIGLPLSPERELVDDVPALFAKLRRTRIEPARDLDDDDLAGELAGHDQVLAIVRTRRDARSAFAKLTGRSDAGSYFHLSTDMCAAHRSEVVGVIKQRLADGELCRVVSTSLIEAGVDVDFPVVYRAMAGLDSIAQAAGRCNREGREREGRVVVFRPERAVPSQMAFLRNAIDAAERVLGTTDDPLSPDAMEEFFAEYFWARQNEWDEHDVLGCFRLGAFNFRQAAERYRLIDSAQTPVVVPWRKGKGLIKELYGLRYPAGLELRRRCQRYTVGVYEHELGPLVEAGLVVEANAEMARGVFALTSARHYSSQTGLVRNRLAIDPEDLIP